jgi:hypothetical protein
MDDDRSLWVPGATNLPVEIETGTDGRTLHVLLIGEDEIVGVLLFRRVGELQWSRSRRSGPDGLELGVQIGPDDHSERTWISANLGGGLLWEDAPSDATLELPEPADLVTGRPSWLARVEDGSGALEIGVLPLARRDVRFGRKRIWRLKSGLWPRLSAAQRRILVDSRTGMLQRTN